jgi:hypothetical protein
MVQKPAFSGVPGINTNFKITQDSSPWYKFEIVFSPEIFKHMEKETNRNAKQQINKKEHEGLLPPKSVFARWNKVTTNSFTLSATELSQVITQDHGK